MGYRFAVVAWGSVAALLAYAGCRSVPRVTGTYELRAVNQRPLPFHGEQGGGNWVEVTGGTMTLNPDGTFERRFLFHVHSGLAVRADSSVQEGKYERRMSTIVLHVPGGDASAALAGETLTMRIRGWTYVFRKPET